MVDVDVDEMIIELALGMIENEKGPDAGECAGAVEDADLVKESLETITEEV